MAWPVGWVDLSTRLRFDLSLVCGRNTGGSFGEWWWDFSVPEVPLLCGSNFTAVWSAVERHPESVRKARVISREGQIERLDIAFQADALRPLPYLFLLGGNERLAIAKILKASGTGKWMVAQIGKEPVSVWAAAGSGAASALGLIAQKDKGRWTVPYSPKWVRNRDARWKVSETRSPCAMVRLGNGDSE